MTLRNLIGDQVVDRVSGEHGVPERIVRAALIQVYDLLPTTITPKEIQIEVTRLTNAVEDYLTNLGFITTKEEDDNA